MLERDSLKILDAMPEFEATRDPTQQAVLQHDLLIEQVGRRTELVS